MKKILAGLLLGLFCVTGMAMAETKGDFALGLNYKSVEFDTAGDVSADLVGVGINYHGKIAEFSGLNVNIGSSLGYYYGEVDIEGYAGDNPNIEDIAFSVGVGISKDFGSIRTGADVNATYDHFTIDSADNLDPFGIGGNIYALYGFGNNHNIGIRAEYIKFLSEDELDYSVGAGITYGFRF